MRSLSLCALAPLAGAVTLQARATSATSSTCDFCTPAKCIAKPMAIKNAGFQSGHLAPWKVDYSFFHEPLTNFSVVQMGPQARALRIDTIIDQNNYADQPRLEQMNLTICPTHQYNVSFDYQVLKAYTDTFITISLLTRAEGFVEPQEGIGGPSAPTNVTTTGWQHAWGLVNDYFLHDLFVSIVPDIRTSVLQKVKGPAVLVDNVAVVPVKSLIDPACPRPPALLANSHFESGELAPWTVGAEPKYVNYSLVSDQSRDNQPHALRVQIFGNNTFAGLGISHPVHGGCLGYVYVFELAYNVITPLPHISNTFAYESYEIDVDGCEGVSATKQTGNPGGYLPFNTTGPGVIKSMCRMRRNGATTYSVEIDVDYPQVNATIDILGLSARLANASDFT